LICAGASFEKASANSPRTVFVGILAKNKSRNAWLHRKGNQQHSMINQIRR
jgi:hypothetical protein